MSNIIFSIILVCLFQISISINPNANLKVERLTDSLALNNKEWKIFTNEIKFCPNFIMNVAPNEKTAALETYATLFIEKTQQQVDKFALISSKEEKINNLQVLTIDYKAVSNSTNLGGTAFFIRLPSGVLIVNCMAENNPSGSYVNYRKLFINIRKTIKLA
jgi:hypothetical protein